jgi:hypothetical protein
LKAETWFVGVFAFCKTSGILCNKTTKWHENPAHHPHTDAHGTQMTETNLDEMTPEVVDFGDVTTEIPEGMDRGEMWTMVGVIETRISHLIGVGHMVDEMTDTQNMTNEREIRKGTETGKDIEMAQGTEIGQALLVALHHLPGLHILGQSGLVHGRALAQGLLLLWTNQSQTLHLPVFLQRLPTP